MSPFTSLKCPSNLKVRATNDTLRRELADLRNAVRDPGLIGTVGGLVMTTSTSDATQKANAQGGGGGGALGEPRRDS